MKKTKIQPIGTIETPSENRKLSMLSYSSKYECNRITVFYVSFPPTNVTNNTTPAAIYVQEYSKNIQNTT